MLGAPKMVPAKVPIGIVFAGIGGLGAYSLYSSGHPVLATAAVGLSYLSGKGPTMRAIEELRDRFNLGNIQSSNSFSKFDMVEDRIYRTGWYGKKAVAKVLEEQ